MYPYEKLYDHVLTIEKADHIATITLDCPQNNNKLCDQLVDELDNALNDCMWDQDVRVIIMKGNGDVSFGQGDITQIIPTIVNLPAGRKAMFEIANLIKKIYTMSKPIIGIADGGCIGGGCNLLLSCDAVIASEKAYFHQVFTNFCLVPDTGGLWALQRLVGPMKAKMIAMTAEPVLAKEAYELGMVYKVVEPGKTYEEALVLANKIAVKSPVGIAHTKMISNRLHDLTMENYFAMEADYLTLGVLSDDFKETLAALGQNRAPEYKGY